MRLDNDKNNLIKKCKFKFNSFINNKKTKNKFNINRDYYTKIVKQQKNKSLNNTKKTITSNNININNNKYLKKSNHNKNKSKNFNNKIINNKNKEKFNNNYYRNNKSINPIFLDDYDNNSNYINRSNYIIKVKTKINPNDKELLVKNINNMLNYMEDINDKTNFNDNENDLSDLVINPNHFRRLNSNNITKKHIRLFREFQQEESLLEKIKFIQLWWKTIFQIIKIQKHVRGFLYRQKLIEELDREEVIVDNLLFLIKSYKKIVFNIFIYRLRNYKPGTKYYLNKWNEKIKKSIIIHKLLNQYYKNINKNRNSTNNNVDINKKCNKLMKYEYLYDNNYFLRDSTNILLNNMDNRIDNYNKDSNDNNSDDEYRKLSIENYSIKKKFFDNNMIIPSINDRKNYIAGKNINNNSNNFNKIFNKNISKTKFAIKKKKKLKHNLNINNGHRNSLNINNKGDDFKNIQEKNQNDYIKNIHMSYPNPLILSSHNKILKKRIKNYTSIINTESYKSEHKNKININNMKGNRFKRNKIANKLVSKEIVPFSMSNNIENNSETKKLNSLTTSNNALNLQNKKLKIYENHLYEYKNLYKNKTNIIKNDYIDVKKIKKNKNKSGNNKNKIFKKANESSHFLRKNIKSASIDHLKQINNIIEKDNNNNNYSELQNQNILSNNTNTTSSFNSSFLNYTKPNPKINKCLNIWYNKIYYDKIKRRLRSLSKISKFSNKLKKKIIFAFLENLKIYGNFIRFKKLFNRYKIKIIKKSLLKCSIYKKFINYKEIVFKKMIFEKLKEYLIRNQKKIYNEIEKDIKNFNKDKNYIFNYQRQNLIVNHQNQVFPHINPFSKNNNLMIRSINKSMLNLISPLNPINLNNNDNIEYNYTEENQNYNNYNNKKNIDIITQINQLTMVINLVEQLRFKNKIKNENRKISLLKYFKNWKNSSDANKDIKNNFIGDHTVATEIEDYTQYTINDNIQSESEYCTKSGHLSSKSNNLINKYIPVRGIKCFQGKIKQKKNNTKNNSNKKYKINNFIDKYQTNTITTSLNKNNFKTFNKKENEIIENNNINDNFRTFNDNNSLDFNNILFNSQNKYMKINNFIQKTKINDLEQNSKNIYHRKTLGATLKNNVLNNLNDISRFNNNIRNYQYANDSINTTIDNYSSNFYGILNNATFLGDYKLEPIEPFIFLNNDDNNNNGNNYNIINNKYNINENYDKKSLFGFKKLNKIEEKEICFFQDKNNINNINNNIDITNNKNNKYNNYHEDISIVSEMKKYYNEDIDIYNNEEQKRKFNSFIINIFNNNIILTQNIKYKRSKSK